MFQNGFRNETNFDGSNSCYSFLWYDRCWLYFISSLTALGKNESSDARSITSSKSETIQKSNADYSIVELSTDELLVDFQENSPENPPNWAFVRIFYCISLQNKSRILTQNRAKRSTTPLWRYLLSSIAAYHPHSLAMQSPLSCRISTSPETSRRSYQLPCFSSAMW
jgi:hypothetical protein